MRALIQVAFGLVLAAIGTVASIYLGLLLNRPPNFRTGAETGDVGEMRRKNSRRSFGCASG
jgi:hypothetical protein